MTPSRIPFRFSTLPLTVFASLLALGVIVPLPANALGLGAIRVASTEGQPLKAEVDLVIDNSREILDVVIRNGSAEEYERQGFGPRGAMAGLRIAVQQRGKKYVAMLSTREPMNDPYAYIVLEGSAGNGHVMRSYPVLLPLSALGQSSAKEMNVERMSQTPATADKIPERVPSLVLRKANASIAASEAASDNDAIKLYETLIEIGPRPKAKQLQRVSGIGKQESIGMALSRIVPKGWKGFAGDVDVRSMAPIDWAARNDYWIAILDTVMAKTSLTATVNWPAREVTFRSLDLPQPAQLSTAQLSHEMPVSATFPSSQASVHQIPNIEAEPKITPSDVASGQAQMAALREEQSRSGGKTVADNVVKDSALAQQSIKKVVVAPAKVVTVKTGGLSLDTAVRNVLPAGYSVLTNDQSAIQHRRVRTIKASADWQETVRALVAVSGSTVTIDDEKKRIFVSLNT